MKQQATTREPLDKEGPSSGQPRPARREPAGGRESQFDLRVSYYATMKPQRVYPLVVEVVSRGPGAGPEGTGGHTVALRPVVPGALVAPAELPLDVSRPGAQATFHVTPVAKGRLPEACVRVLHDGRQVQELRTRMTAKTQRTTWVLLLLAFILPPLVVHWAITDPLKGRVPIVRKAPPEEARAKDEPQDEAAAKGKGGKGGPGKVGGAAAPPPLDPSKAPPVVQPPEIPGRPGEILTARLSNTLRMVLPNFPYSDEIISGIATPTGVVYDVLCQWAEDAYIPCWLCVGLLITSFGSWALHKPTRVRVLGSVALPRPALGAARYAETGETLPLAPPRDDLT